MPFPFLPAGIVLAVAVLGGAFAGFAVGLRVIDQAALSARNSIAPGIVAGLRGWSHGATSPVVTSSPPAAAEMSFTGLPHAARTSSADAGEVPVVIEDIEAPTDILLEQVHRH